MIAAWMLYATLVSGLLYGAGIVLERAPAALRWSRRWVWVGTIAGSVLLPMMVAAGRTAVGAGSRLLPPGAADVVRHTMQPMVAAGASGAPGWGRALDLLLVASWIGASLVLLLLFARSHRSLARARRTWSSVDVGGLTVRVAEAHGPAVAGALRAEIVIPRWCLELPAAERALILAHEAEHVRGGDPRLLLLGRCATIGLPWLLPLWWQFRRLCLAVEIDCDARVLQRGFDQPRYGRLLLEVGSRRSRSWDQSRAVAALATPSSQLERRIRAMFDSNSTPRGRWMRAAAAVALSLALVAIACESPTPFEAETEGKASVVTEVPLDVDFKSDKQMALERSMKEIAGSLHRIDYGVGGIEISTLEDRDGKVRAYFDEVEVPAEVAKRAIEEAAGARFRSKAVQGESAPASGEFHFREKAKP